MPMNDTYKSGFAMHLNKNKYIMHMAEVIPPIIRKMYHEVTQSDIYLERSPSPNFDIKVFLMSVMFGKQYLFKSK